MTPGANGHSWKVDVVHWQLGGLYQADQELLAVAMHQHGVQTESCDHRSQDDGEPQAALPEMLLPEDVLHPMDVGVGKGVAQFFPKLYTTRIVPEAQ